MIKESFNQLANYDQIVESLLKEIPQTIALMILDNEGNLIRHNVSKSFENKIDSTELEFYSKLIGLRYKIVDFHKILNGLEITINVFKNNCLFVTSLNSNYTIAILTEKADVEKTRKIIFKIKKEYNVYY